MIIRTHELEPSALGSHQRQIYNGLDAALTYEVWEEISALSNQPPAIYNFARALQGPALEIMLRGFRVDFYERSKGIKLIEAKRDRLNAILQRFAHAVWGKPLNPRSHDQLKKFFYKRMGIPEIWTSQKGVRALRMDRETLEKIEVYFHARPIVAVIKAIREIGKKLDVLTADVDADGRMRTSINIGATTTGRLSSSSSTTGSGTNMFNIEPALRRMFVADPGWKLCGIDKEQAEAREVGWLCWVAFGDASYLDACESTDLHTHTAKLIWPNLSWTGDTHNDRALADTQFYRHFSYRDLSKRGGHGSNYLGTPFTMARYLKVPTKLMEDFQQRYFSAFPCIPRWHDWTRSQLHSQRKLTTVFGRERHFFGRPSDDTTLREAIAYSPQSATADRVNLGMWRIWDHFKGRVQLLLNLYDAVYFQYREDDDEREIIETALRLMEVPLEHNGRVFDIPGEAKVGWNWAAYAEDNPEGLKKWSGGDVRKRSALLEAPM